MTATAWRSRAGGQSPRFDGGGDEAGAQRLGQIEGVAGAGTLVPDDAVGVDLSDHRIAELRLRVVDRVASDHRDPGLGHLGCAARHDLFEQAGVQLLAGKSGHAQGEEGASAHRVDVAHRVGGGDRAELGGVVYDRGEEVDGRYQGAIWGDAIHGGVIARAAEHDVGVDDRWEGAQDETELDRAELAGTAGAVAVLGEPQRRELFHSLLVWSSL